MFNEIQDAMRAQYDPEPGAWRNEVKDWRPDMREAGLIPEHPVEKQLRRDAAYVVKQVEKQARKESDGSQPWYFMLSYIGIILFTIGVIQGFPAWILPLASGLIGFPVMLSIAIDSSLQDE